MDVPTGDLPSILAKWSSEPRDVRTICRCHIKDSTRVLVPAAGIRTRDFPLYGLLGFHRLRSVIKGWFTTAIYLQLSFHMAKIASFTQKTCFIHRKYGSIFRPIFAVETSNGGYILKIRDLVNCPAKYRLSTFLIWQFNLTVKNIKIRKSPSLAQGWHSFFSKPKLGCGFFCCGAAKERVHIYWRNIKPKIHFR